MSNCRPRWCGRRSTARTVNASGAPTGIGVWVTSELAMCTSPTTGKGKSARDISRIVCSNAMMCG